MSWRLLDSPYLDQYRILSINDVAGPGAIIKLCEQKGRRYIDVLITTDSDNYPGMVRILSTLALWAAERGYIFIRFYTSNRRLTRCINKRLLSFVANPRLVFFAKDRNLHRELTTGEWNLELIDSDLEWN
jgi:hypothetical protein